ncbi:MAG TPA: hypothetical protein VOA87_00790 [Thermoanaerobaculia bacterium]|nr:hypothetical protein [Thermoanaerobaculia bacterium]
MPRTPWILALLISFVLTGALAAQQTPAPATAVPVNAQATQPALNAAPHVALSAAALADILGTPGAGGISTVPAPTWMNCTLFQCRQPCVSGCHAIGCISVCTSLVDCTCDCSC